jgi:hypothetical protein
MLGVIDTKVYVVIGLITAALLLAVNYFDKGEVAVGWLQQQELAASGSGLGRAVAGLIARPLMFALDNPAGAILGGLLWPVLLLWLVLLVLLLAFAFIAPGIFKARCTASAGC